MADAVEHDRVTRERCEDEIEVAEAAEQAADESLQTMLGRQGFAVAYRGLHLNQMRFGTAIRRCLLLSWPTDRHHFPLDQFDNPHHGDTQMTNRRTILKSAAAGLVAPASLLGARAKAEARAPIVPATPPGEIPAEDPDLREA